MDNEIVVVLAQTIVESDHAADEFGRKDSDTAIVEQIDAGGFFLFLEDRVVAEMRIAVDDAIAAEGKPPGGEHRSGKTIADGERLVLVFEQPAAFEPIEREQ